MKQIMIFLASALFTITTVHAQTEGASASSARSQSYPTKDMKKVREKDVPSSLRNTLQEAEYKGWEEGTLYYNQSTGEYALQYVPIKAATNDAIQNTNTKSQAVWCRFDKNGKRIPDA
jgi:hypothetical protein